jgi:hypothetical protein
MSDETWKCQACKAFNDATASSCSTCGSPSAGADLDIFSGITILALCFIIFVYAYRIIIANPWQPMAWILITPLFSGQYLLVALAIFKARSNGFISRSNGFIVTAWVLVGLNGLGYAFGGFSYARESGIVLLPVIILAWIVCLFGFAFAPPKPSFTTSIKPHLITVKKNGPKPQ